MYKTIVLFGEIVIGNEARRDLPFVKSLIERTSFGRLSGYDLVELSFSPIT
jgi:hypothetical protein